MSVRPRSLFGRIALLLFAVIVIGFLAALEAQGRRDEAGRAIRLSTARVLDRSQLGEFSPRPQQGATRTIFVPAMPPSLC